MLRYNLPLQKNPFFWISSLWWLRWTPDRSQSFCMAATDTPDAQYHRQTCNSAGDRAIAVWTTTGEPELTQCSMSVSVRTKGAKSMDFQTNERYRTKGSPVVVHTAIALSPALLQVWRWYWVSGVSVAAIQNDWERPGVHRSYHRDEI